MIAERKAIELVAAEHLSRGDHFAIDGVTGGPVQAIRIIPNGPMRAVRRSPYDEGVSGLVLRDIPAGESAPFNIFHRVLGGPSALFDIPEPDREAEIMAARVALADFGLKADAMSDAEVARHIRPTVLALEDFPAEYTVERSRNARWLIWCPEIGTGAIDGFTTRAIRAGERVPFVNVMDRRNEGRRAERRSGLGYTLNYSLFGVGPVSREPVPPGGGLIDLREGTWQDLLPL